jgi:hypothetical protein
MLEPCNQYSLPKIETEMFYSTGYWAQVKDDIAAYDALDNAYEGAKKEYDDIMSQRKTIEDQVLERLEEIRNQEARKDCAEELFARYLELANNDFDIAIKFLEDAKQGLYIDFAQHLRDQHGYATTTLSETEK